MDMLEKTAVRHVHRSSTGIYDPSKENEQQSKAYLREIPHSHVDLGISLSFTLEPSDLTISNLILLS
jgi:hypothetical protein